MMAVFRSREAVLDLFIKHLDNTPCADFLCRLIEMESSTLKVLQVPGHLINDIHPEFVVVGRRRIFLKADADNWTKLS